MSANNNELISKSKVPTANPSLVHRSWIQLETAGSSEVSNFQSRLPPKPKFWFLISDAKSINIYLPKKTEINVIKFCCSPVSTEWKSGNAKTLRFWTIFSYFKLIFSWNCWRSFFYQSPLNNFQRNPNSDRILPSALPVALEHWLVEQSKAFYITKVFFRNRIHFFLKKHWFFCIQISKNWLCSIRKDCSLASLSLLLFW